MKQVTAYMLCGKELRVIAGRYDTPNLKTFEQVNSTNIHAKDTGIFFFMLSLQMKILPWLAPGFVRDPEAEDSPKPDPHKLR